MEGARKVQRESVNQSDDDRSMEMPNLERCDWLPIGRIGAVNHHLYDAPNWR